MDVVELLSSLVSMVSVNDPVRGLKPSVDVARFIRDYLDEHGVEAFIIEDSGYYSVYGSIGSGELCLLFLAHYDTVPVDPSCWSYDPFNLTIVDGRGYGRGAVDDKANVAALMITLEKLASMKLPCRILYAFTGDEEIGGLHGAGYIARMLYRENMLPRYLVNADGVGEKIITRRRKAYKIVVEAPSRKRVVRGSIEKIEYKPFYPVSNHSHSAYFLHGVDSHPLITLSVFVRENNVSTARLYGSFIKSNVVPGSVGLEYVVMGKNGGEVVVDDGLRDLLEIVYPVTKLVFPTEKPSLYGVTITPNMYEYDGRVHRIVFDLRAMVSNKKAIEEALANLIDSIGYGGRVRYRVVEGSGGYQYTPTSSLIARIFKDVLDSMGIEPVFIEGPGASDSRHFTVYGVEAVDFGPRGGNVHGCNEYVVLDSLKRLPEIYYRVAVEVSRRLCGSI